MKQYDDQSMAPNTSRKPPRMRSKLKTESQLSRGQEMFDSGAGGMPATSVGYRGQMDRESEVAQRASDMKSAVQSQPVTMRPPNVAPPSTQNTMRGDYEMGDTESLNRRYRKR